MILVYVIYREHREEVLNEPNKTLTNMPRSHAKIKQPPLKNTKFVVASCLMKLSFASRDFLFKYMSNNVNFHTVFLLSWIRLISACSM
jgi:hypothetical protein